MALSEGERVSVRVSSRRPVRAKIADDPVPGFQVFRTDLDDALARDDAGVRVATSRHGEELSVSRLAELTGRFERDGLTVAFGAPTRGLPPMLGVSEEAVRESESPGGFDVWLNTVPAQGSEVVRTEEAMFAALGCLNLR
jgi:predicted SPOUT superfamily RNA methylase MTH1